MFHHLTNEMMDDMGFTDEQKQVYIDRNKKEEVEEVLKKYKWYKGKKQVLEPSPTCSCGRVAGFGIDVSGCVFLQYCCDGYLDTSI